MSHISVSSDDLERLFHHAHAAVVYFALLDRASKKTRLGLTINALARRVELHPSRIEEAFAFLTDEGFIRIQENKRSLEVLDGDDVLRVPFSFRNTDETRLKVAEAEIQRLTNEVERVIMNIESGIRQTTRNDERDLIIEIESVFGRGLQPVDAYWVGRMVSAFGPQRVKQEFRRMKLAKNPIKALVAALSYGSRGKAAQQRETENEHITYQEL